MHLNKFVCYNPKFRSIDENEREKERGGKVFKKMGFFFLPKEKAMLFKESQPCLLFLNYCEYSEEEKETVPLAYFQVHSHLC